MIRAPIVLALAGCAALAACASDPQYLVPQVALEAGGDADPSLATHIITLPIEPETGGDAEERAQLAAELGVEVPYVRRDDLRVAIHWTLRNLTDEPGTAFLNVNASNEWFTYIPTNFVLDPDEDEEPPPLLGGSPIVVAGLGQVSGVIREDEVARGALDVELMSRGGLNAFAAILGRHSGLEEFELAGGGGPVPAEAYAGLVQFEVILTANRHMVLEYSVRVRDQRGILHPALLDADPAEIVAFAPIPFGPVVSGGGGGEAVRETSR
jgi:hypothetical protein